MMNRTPPHSAIELSDIAEVFPGFSPYGRSPAGKGNNVQGLVSIKNIQDGCVLTDEVETVTVEDPAKLDAYRLQEGDILLSARGSSFRTGVCGDSAAGLVAGSNILVIRMKESAPVGPWLLSAMLNSSKGSVLLTALAEGAAIQSIKPQRLLTMRLSVPAMDQAKILEAYYIEHMAFRRASLKALDHQQNIINGLLSPLLSLQD